jgi:hypothetical protein
MGLFNFSSPSQLHAISYVVCGIYAGPQNIGIILHYVVITESNDTRQMQLPAFLPHLSPIHHP